MSSEPTDSHGVSAAATLVSAYPLPPRSIFADMTPEEIEQMSPPPLPTEEITVFDLNIDLKSNNKHCSKEHFKTEYKDQLLKVKKGHDDYILSFKEMIKNYGSHEVIEKFIIAKHICLEEIEELERLEEIRLLPKKLIGIINK